MKTSYWSYLKKWAIALVIINVVLVSYLFIPPLMLGRMVLKLDYWVVLISLFVVNFGTLVATYTLWRQDNGFQEEEGGNDLLLNIKPYEDMEKREIKKATQKRESIDEAEVRKFLTNIKEQLEAHGSATIGIKDLPLVKKLANF